MNKKTQKLIVGAASAALLALGTSYVIQSNEEKIAKAQKEILKNEETTEERMKSIVLEKKSFENNLFKIDIHSPKNRNKITDFIDYKRESIISDFLSQKFENDLNGKLEVKQRYIFEQYSELAFKNTIILKTSLGEDSKYATFTTRTYFTDKNGNLLTVDSFLKNGDITKLEEKLKTIEKEASISADMFAYIEGKNFIMEDNKNTYAIPVKDIISEMKEGYYQKQIALTFDDGPSKKTVALLKVLEEYDVKATFFMLGDSVARHEEIAKQVHDSGHQIGGHSWKHASYPTLSEDAMREDFMKTNEVIKEITGEDTHVFRPPYGAYNGSVSKVLAENNVDLTLWSIDTLDWKNRSSSAVSNQILTKVKAGDIVLMHDLYDTTVEGTKQALNGLKEQGYTFVTVDELY